MNGECKSYRLNDPMAWKEFVSMPDDVKVTYIKLLRQKFNVPNKYIAEMLGTNNSYFSKEVIRLGISEGKNCRGRCTPWDKEGFLAWWHGVDQLPTHVSEEPVQEEQEVFVEDDLPFEEPEFVPVEKYRVMDDRMAALEHRMEELLKENEELKAVHEKDKGEIEWLRNECDNQRIHARILEAQMDVVRLIFGGKNNA